MTTLARALDAIPLVATTAERTASFANPVSGQRVQNLETRAIERYDSALGWVVDSLLGGIVNVKAFGAKGDNATDDTVAIQAAIDAAGAYAQVDFPDGLYKCVGLTNTYIGQRWVGHGLAQLKKNGNGVILTGSAREQEYHCISFDGDSGTYTGNNVNLTGDSPILRNCSSYDAAGRALLATGTGVQIIGDNGTFATTDATGTGYDIEIGVSGTATLYHRIVGVRTSQATGGFKFVDCGSQQVQGCQFGKYTVAAGTSPAGVNGGAAIGNRILGVITIDLSNSSFLGNARGASATLTYGAGTSGHLFIGEEPGGPAITNNGNDSSLIMRQVGNDGDIKIKYGDDSSEAIMVAEPDAAGLFRFPGLRIANNRTYAMRNAADDDTAGSLGTTAANNVQLVALLESLQLFVPSGKLHQRAIASVVHEVLSATGHTLGTAEAAAGSLTRFKKQTTGIADATATTCGTVTIPNSVQSTSILLTVIGALGAGGAIGADEASASNSYILTIVRTAGVNAVGVLSTAFGAAAAAVAGAATVTATLDLGAVVGAVGASNTIPIRVTITKSGGASASHTAMLRWEIINQRASGVTVA